MEPYLLPAALAGVALLVILYRLRPLKRWPKDMPYRKREGLLSRGEMAFYRVLVSAVPEGTILCPKVRIADVVRVNDGAWKDYGRPIAGKHLDFILARAGSLEILLAIELDDRTHDRRGRRERDAFVDAVLASAGVPLLRVRAAAGYGVEEVRRGLKEGLGSNPDHEDTRSRPARAWSPGETRQPGAGRYRPVGPRNNPDSPR